MILKSQLITKALRVAAIHHGGTTRKEKEAPYIVHPVEVAMVLLENGCSEDVIAAALLHDTLEDTKLTEKDLRQMFKDRVVDLVIGASEPLENRDQTPWEERKQHTIDYLKTAGREIQLLSCADKLSNARSMLRDYNQVGNELWDRFNRGYEQQKWYYTGLVESLKALEDNEIYIEFKAVVKKLFKLK